MTSRAYDGTTYAVAEKLPTAQALSPMSGFSASA
jgi:hypothetical protein